MAAMMLATAWMLFRVPDPAVLSAGESEIRHLFVDVLHLLIASHYDLQRHQYPAAVASLQAEALAIAACLSTFMKFDGVFTCRPGDAFVKTLFADVTSAGALRGYAAFDETASVPVADDVVAHAGKRRHPWQWLCC